MITEATEEMKGIMVEAGEVMKTPLLDGIMKLTSVYYHGTRPSLMDKILREGLDPSLMGTGEMTRGEKREYQSLSLTTDKDYARGYSSLGAAKDAKGFLAKMKAQMSIKHPVLRIDMPSGTKGLVERQSIPVGDRVVDEYLYPKGIPPEWITIEGAET